MPVGIAIIIGVAISVRWTAISFFLASWPWSVIGVSAVAVAWWFWWRLPKRQVERLRLIIRDPKARADVEDNFRKTCSQLLGGAAVLIGAALAYLQFTEQQQTSQRQFKQQQQASRDLLISNQVSKGFELLGNEKKIVAQRLGGIYALEGVMNSSKEYHQPILEALCAFVRDETHTKTASDAPAMEIQVTLTVIGRRQVKSETVDLGREVFAAVDLTGAHIQRVNLAEANLRTAKLEGIDLSGAELYDADLSSADLDSAILDGATLTDAHLDNAIISDAHMKSARLSGADLHDAHLSRAHLNGAYLGPGVYSRPGANLSGADLSRADLSGADLSGADLTYANLSGAALNSAHLYYTNLSDANLSGANLSDANLNDAQGLTSEQLAGACGNEHTRLDPPLTIKPCQPEPSSLGDRP
jgi:uncharacterized protein YjbI with pentapeptide repeats